MADSLSLSLLEIELKETNNSIAHLERSIAELKQAMAEDPDPEYKDAISENIVAIAKYRAKAAEIAAEIAKAKARPVMKNEPIAVFVPKGHPSAGRDLLAELHSGRPSHENSSAYASTGPSTHVHGEDAFSHEPSMTSAGVTRNGSAHTSTAHFEVEIRPEGGPVHVPPHKIRTAVDALMEGYEDEADRQRHLEAERYLIVGGEEEDKTEEEEGGMWL